MTRKDYIALADALKATRPRDNDPRFDRAKFIAATESD